MEETLNATKSRILLAVSQTTDPNGGWYYYAINSKLNIGGTDMWADYPGVAIDNVCIYITADMKGFGGDPSNRTRLWILPKHPFYDGTPPSAPPVYDPYALAGLSSNSRLIPAHIFGSTPVDPNGGTFLAHVQDALAPPDDGLIVIRVANPAGSPTFSKTNVKMGNVNSAANELADAPQLGTTDPIDTAYDMVYNLVWRSGLLYGSLGVVDPATSRTRGHWFQVDTSTLNGTDVTLASTSHGNLPSGNYTFFPSVMVDAAGNMAVGYAGSSATIHPGAYYTGRAVSDPAGQLQAEGTLAPGTDYYIRHFGDTRNRWGDFSGIALDPANETTFWVYNEFAMTRGTVINSEDGRYCTQIGSFTFLTPGNIDPNFLVPSPGLNSDTFAIQPQADGKVIIGGGFTQVAGSTRNYLARLTSGGALDTWAPTVNGTIYAIVLQSDGKVLIGGAFTQVNGQSRAYLARLNADGTTDTSFPQTTANNYVFAITLDTAGKIYIGGQFTGISDDARYHVAKLNSNGTTDTSYVPPTIDGNVWTITLDDSGLLLIGGDFLNAGVSRPRIARLNLNGSNDTSFNPGTGFDLTVKTILYRSSRVDPIWVGGSFTTYNGANYNHFIILQYGGAVSINANSTGANGTVNAIRFQSNDKAVICGAFTSFYGTTANRIVRLVPSNPGSTDANFQIGTGFDNSVSTIALDSAGKILAGGQFASFNRTSRIRSARLYGD